jgi:hypothetical protein
MKTVIKPESIRRWQGTISDVCSLAASAQQCVKERISAEPPISVSTEYKGVETEFDTLEDFMESSKDDFTQLEKITITVGDFIRDSALSTEVVLSNSLQSPGAQLRVRGHDKDHVFGVASDLRIKAARNARKLPLSNGNIALIVLVAFSIAQYFFYTHVSLPFSGFLGYVILIAATILPLFVVFLAGQATHWLIPQMELVANDGSTRWARNRRKAFAGIGVISSAILAPLVVGVILHALHSS